MFVVFTVAVVTGLIATVDGAAMPHFLLPFVRVNAAYSMFWMEESGHGTWETTQCV